MNVSESPVEDLASSLYHALAGRRQETLWRQCNHTGGALT